MITVTAYRRVIARDSEKIDMTMMALAAHALRFPFELSYSQLVFARLILGKCVRFTKLRNC